MEETFLDLLIQLDKKYGNRTAIRWNPADQNASMTYHQLLDAVKARASVLSGEMASSDHKTYVIQEKILKDWIIEVLAATTAGYQTVLADPSVSADRIREIEESGEPFYPGCLLFFTSGTTASGKAVVLPQRALIRSAWNGQQMLACHREDRLLCMLPLTHVFGFVCSFLWPLSRGAEIDLSTGMRGMMTDAKAYDPTIISVVPSLLYFLMKARALNAGLQTILVGAGPLSREAVAAVLDLGIHIRFGYGLTETASGLAISTEDGEPYAMSLCPDTQMRLGAEDEILVRTPCMMEGYFHDPTSTAAKLDAEGWLSTGDIGRFDENGRIHILGRRNDVLVMPNGTKIYLPEAEESLSRDLRCECALTLENDTLTLIAGIPDGILSDDNRTELGSWETGVKTALDAWNDGRPAASRVMKVHFREGTFPRTATGKLQRWKL